MNKEIQEKQDRLVLNCMWDAITRIEEKLDDLIYTVEGLEGQDQDLPELIEGVQKSLDDLCNIKK